MKRRRKAEAFHLLYCAPSTLRNLEEASTIGAEANTAARRKGSWFWVLAPLYYRTRTSPNPLKENIPMPPYRKPESRYEEITPQKMARKLLAAIKSGVDTSAGIVDTLKLYDPGELRLAFESLRDRGKILVLEGKIVAL